MLVRNSPTLKHALRNIVRELHLHDRGAVPTLAVANGEAKLRYTIYQPGVTATKQIYSLGAVVAYNILRTLCGPGWQPRSVFLPHAEPEDLAPYRRAFWVTLSFDAEQVMLVFAADWLERPLASAEPALYQVLVERAT